MTWCPVVFRSRGSRPSPQPTSTVSVPGAGGSERELISVKPPVASVVVWCAGPLDQCLPSFSHASLSAMVPGLRALRIGSGAANRSYRSPGTAAVLIKFNLSAFHR